MAQQNLVCGYKSINAIVIRAQEYAIRGYNSSDLIGETCFNYIFNKYYKKAMELYDQNKHEIISNRLVQDDTRLEFLDACTDAILSAIAEFEPTDPNNENNYRHFSSLIGWKFNNIVAIRKTRTSSKQDVLSHNPETLELSDPKVRDAINAQSIDQFNAVNEFYEYLSRENLQKLIGVLPEDLRNAFAVYIENNELTNAEIAQKLGLSYNQFKHKWQRIRTFIENCITAKMVKLGKAKPTEHIKDAKIREYYADLYDYIFHMGKFPGKKPTPIFTTLLPTASHFNVENTIEVFLKYGVITQFQRDILNKKLKAPQCTDLELIKMFEIGELDLYYLYHQVNTTYKDAKQIQAFMSTNNYTKTELYALISKSSLVGNPHAIDICREINPTYQQFIKKRAKAKKSASKQKISFEDLLNFNDNN